MTASTAPTLTERYVQEVVRRIPADQRSDVADELRATIADTIDARAEDTPEEAERAVLTEMGDPIRLAAKYADRPLSLIGPELYPAYIRLLKTLLTMVLPIVVAVIVVIDVLENRSASTVVGSGIGAFLTVGGQMIAWMTVVFALIDRAQRSGPRVEAPEWTPDNLPEPRRPDREVLAGGAAIAWNLLLLGAIVWQHVAPYRSGDGRVYEVLDPALWSGWIWPILAGLAAMVLLECLRVARRGGTRAWAVWYAVAEAVFALPLAWIFYQREIFNPEFLTDVSRGWTIPGPFYTVAALTVLAVSAVEVAKRFRGTGGN